MGGCLQRFRAGKPAPGVVWLGWERRSLEPTPRLPPLMSVSASQALYWFNYELAKGWLNGLRPKDQTSVGVSFVAGGVSGMVS